MPCYFPIPAWRHAGQAKLVFTAPRAGQNVIETLHVPCGQCVGCRLKRSREWALRCVHEASLYSRNSFITLTYNNENLPNPPSLRVRDFQLFVKRLRKKFDGIDEVIDADGLVSKPIRFFQCGEIS